MTLTELKYIVAVARERHFGRAAAACFVSQPTLSVGVKRLEEELGLQIFERGHRGDMRITAMGEAVIEQAQRVLEESERLKSLADASRDPLVGPLRIGFIYTIGPYLLPPLIAALHRDAPAMPVEIVEGFTADLAEQLARGDLDAVVLSLPFMASGLTITPVYREPFTLAMPTGHSLSKLDVVEVDRLAEHDLLLLGSGHCFRDQVLTLCPSCVQGQGAGRMQKTLEGGSLETMRMMVASGAGITVLPCSSTKTASDLAGSLVCYRPFVPPAPFRDVAVASRARFNRKPAVDLLCDTIRAIRPACCESLDR